MFKFLKKEIQKFQLEKKEKAYLLFFLALYFIYGIFHILHFPLFIDEALTFNGYTSQNIGTIISNYEEPNNHIFFSMIAHFLNYLPFPSLINLRIPNLLFGLIASLLFYFTLRSKYNHKVSIIPHLFFSFCYFFTYYSVFARGYMIIILATVVCYYCIEKYINQFNTKYLLIYSIASIIGFYTIPVFLYTSATFILYLFINFFKNKNQLYILLKYHILIAVSVLILYTPILIYNGIDAIINNEWTKKIPTSEIIEGFKSGAILNMYDKITGLKSLVIISFFLVTLLFLYIRKPTKNEKKDIQFIILSFILPFIFLFIQHVIPGTRTWCYLIIPFSIGIGLILKRILNIIEIPNLLILTSGIFVIIINFYIFYKSHPTAAKDLDFSTQQFVDKLTPYHFKSFYIEDEPKSYIEAFLMFENHTEQIKYYNKSCSENSIPWNKIECLILKKDSKYANKIKNKTILFESSTHTAIANK
jgi:uncharacterized membrane protein